MMDCMQTSGGGGGVICDNTNVDMRLTYNIGYSVSEQRCCSGEWLSFL